MYCTVQALVQIPQILIPVHSTLLHYLCFPYDKGATFGDQDVLQKSELVVHRKPSHYSYKYNPLMCSGTLLLT